MIKNACDCDEKKKPIEERDWSLLDYKCNHSAFNGYKRTPSDYSCVLCDSCGATWRTKAGYVDKLNMNEKGAR